MIAQYLTVDEIAQRLAVTPETVRGMIKARRLSSIRVGRQYRVRESELARYLERMERPAVRTLFFRPIRATAKRAA